MKKYLNILLILSSFFLAGCDVEAKFREAILPAQRAFQQKADSIQQYIKSLDVGSDVANDPNNNGDVLTIIQNSTDVMDDVAGFQESIFHNPNFLSMEMTDTVTINDVGFTTPITYYASAPAPIRATTYAMSQIQPGDGEQMSALGMVQWLALAVSLPFTMMRALTATTTYLGPLGLLLSWVTIAGLWFMAVLTLDFIVGLVRNAGGVVRVFTAIAGLFK